MFVIPMLDVIGCISYVPRDEVIESMSNGMDLIPLTSFERDAFERYYYYAVSVSADRPTYNEIVAPIIEGHLDQLKGSLMPNESAMGIESYMDLDLDDLDSFEF